MANSWFRLYAEFATDPKVQMMSEANQRRFIMLLCLRCSNDDVTLHDEEVAFQLRISNEEWAQTKALFLSKNLIEEDSTPTAWERRQFVSDSSAARVARHRAKKKQACNVTETPPDTDTDTELTPPLPPLQGGETGIVEIETDHDLDTDPLQTEGSEPKRLRKSSEATTFAAWLAGVKERGEKPISEYEALWTYADSVSLPHEYVELAWFSFADHYRTDEKAKRKRYADWKATFLNAIKGNYRKLWFWSERDNAFRLTTVGQQLDMALQAKGAA